MTVHKYILQYKIAKGQKFFINEQIRILEEYKEQEFTENGHMNWQPCITKQEKNRNVWIYAMKSFSGSVKANML